tara:strand:- start:1620 stop:1913 length:294 start_codon:yes stop_codon:yes gene_type:complete
MGDAKKRSKPKKTQIGHQDIGDLTVYEEMTRGAGRSKDPDITWVTKLASEKQKAKKITKGYRPSVKKRIQEDFKEGIDKSVKKILSKGKKKKKKGKK